MRIAIVTQSYHPRTGGVTEHVHHTATSLRRRGHHVTVVTTHFNGTRDGEPGVRRIGRNVLVPANGAWVNVTVGWNLYRRLKSTLHDLQPDVVHTHCPLAPTLPILALKAAPRQCRLVGTFHAAAKGLIGYQLFKPLIAQVIDRIDTRIAVSEAAQRLAQRYFPGDYTIVPNGVDCRRFTPRHQPLAQFDDDAFNILFVGRMDQRKGLKHLFHAVNMLSGRCSRRLRLIVVGDDGPRRHLLPRVAPGVDLVFTGVVDKDVLHRYFASGDVFCSPAIGRESFGIVLLEAMASGVPVLGTAIPGYLTLLRDRWNALVVPPRSPRALADSLYELMRNETLRWKLRTNALEFSRLFDWERIVDHLESVYRDELVSDWNDSILLDSLGQQTPRAQKA